MLVSAGSLHCCMDAGGRYLLLGDTAQDASHGRVCPAWDKEDERCCHNADGQRDSRARDDVAVCRNIRMCLACWTCLFQNLGIWQTCSIERTDFSTGAQLGDTAISRSRRCIQNRSGRGPAPRESRHASARAAKAPRVAFKPGGGSRACAAIK